jgi:hypothetical protein
MRLTRRQPEIDRSSGSVTEADDLGAKTAARAAQRLAAACHAAPAALLLGNLLLAALWFRPRAPRLTIMGYWGVVLIERCAGTPFGDAQARMRPVSACRWRWLAPVQ